MAGDYETRKQKSRKYSIIVPMSEEKKKPRAATIRTYLGYKERGYSIKAAIVQKAKSLKMPLSKMVLGALKQMYPDLPL